MVEHRGRKLAEDYGANTWLIEKLTEGLSHVDSLLQPEFPANCMNWVLGHIVHRRNTALRLLGREPVWGEDITHTYQSGSDPISAASPARAFADLLVDLQETQRSLEEALQSVEDGILDRVAETDLGEKSVAEHLAGLHWHETFHVGQLDMLRGLALAKGEEAGRSSGR
jgi:hypothetical protein